MNGTRGLWLIFAFAFPVNFIWEIAQMRSYARIPHDHLQELIICGIAAVGDALYTALVYWAGTKLTREPDWILRITGRRAAAVLVSGFVAAASIERISLAAGIWQYSNSMPEVPVLGSGLWPVLQLMLLPLLVFWLIGRLTYRRNRSGSY